MKRRIPTIAAFILMLYGAGAFGKEPGVFVSGEYGASFLAIGPRFPTVEAEKAEITWFLRILRNVLSDLQVSGTHRPQLKFEDKVAELEGKLTLKAKEVPLLEFMVAGAEAYKICITVDANGFTVEPADELSPTR
jgi:hypothetical protein